MDKDQRLKLLEEQAKAKRENRFKSFKAYPKQIEFCNATIDHSEVVLQAGNQLGKSEIGSYMTTAFLTGVYPSWWKGRRFNHPTRGWACGESTVAVRDVSQRKLCGPPGDEALFGTGMIPKQLLIGKILGHGAGGAFDTIKVKHISGGTSELSFKSYDQDRSKWQGSTLDFGWCDEEPPVEHYYELLARLVATDGLAFSTFTPLSGLNLILPRFREQTPEAIKNRIVIQMSMRDAGHLADEKRRAALVATFPKHQRRARIEGLPSMFDGAVFETDVEKLEEPAYSPLPAHWSYIWGIDFGIAHPFAAVLFGWDKDADILHVIHAFRMKDATPLEHAAAMKPYGLIPVAWPQDGTGRESGGETVASQYKKNGLQMLADHATFEEGGLSTEAGVMQMDERMRTGKWKVAAHLREWFDEYRGYHRKKGLIVKEQDDIMSASRIGMMMRRYGKRLPTFDPRGNRGASNGVRMATGLDCDLFG